MSCILKDEHSYAKHEKRPIFLHKEPMCRSVAIESKIKSFNIKCLIAVILICIPIYLFFNDVLKDDNTSRSYSHRRRGGSGPFLFTFAAGYALFSISSYFYTKRQDDILQNMYLNPEGYTYQGRLLTSNDMHFIQHIEYYRRNRSWTIPDGTDLMQYTPANAHEYVLVLQRTPYGELKISDLPVFQPQTSISSDGFSDFDNNSHY